MKINKKNIIVVVTILIFITFFIWFLFPFDKNLLNNNIKNEIYQGFNDSIPTCTYIEETTDLSNKFLLEQFLFRCGLGINSAIRIESDIKTDDIKSKEIKDLFYIDSTYYLYSTNGFEVNKSEFKYIKKFNDEISTSIYLTNNQNITQEQIMSSYLSSNKPKNLATLFAFIAK